MKKAIAVFVMVVLSVAAACAPAAPTPTPAHEPTPTPVEVLATKPEHLEGIWFNPYWGLNREGRYYQFGADGTIYQGQTLEELQEKTWWRGEFWIEDGVFYEQGGCEGIGSYRVYLHIEEGRAVRLRFEMIDDMTCWGRRYENQHDYVRVD